MSLLQTYPLESAGGIDSIIQTAVELRRRREEELKTATANTLGSRFRDAIWKGFTNQSVSLQSSPDPSGSSEEESQDESDKAQTHPSDVVSLTPSVTSRLANAFWQGITNQSAMEGPPSPVSSISSSVSPLPPPSPTLPTPPLASTFPLPPVSSLSPTSSVSSSTTSSLWSYAEKFRDSDAAASLAKVSTNWRVKAMVAWNNRKPTSTSPSLDSSSSQARRETDSAGRKSSQEVANAPHMVSLSDPFPKEAYSPPPRPAYFRPPRDSMLPQPRSSFPFSPPPSDSGGDTPSTQAKGLRDSLSSLKGLATATPAKPSPKSGPRPLLLSSSTLLTKSTAMPSHTPVMHLKNDSMSSVISPASEIARKTRRHDSQSGWESDATESRIVPLNRHSVSPMAPQFRLARDRPQSSPSEKFVFGQDLVMSLGLTSPSTRSEGSASRGWSRVDGLDSPLTLPASPPLYTPPPPITALTSPAVTAVDSQRGSVVISESSIRALEAPNQARKVVRKKTPPSSRNNYTSDSASDALPRSPRLRSKRSPQHLGKLHVQREASEVNTSQNTLTLPVFPDDHDNTVTPRASDFHEDANIASPASSTSSASLPYRTRKISTEGRKAHRDTPEPRARQISFTTHSPKARRISESRLFKNTESGAEEGDDEGYDELLSAYESEESAAHGVVY
jgi:hypothetical protein